MLFLNLFLDGSTYIVLEHVVSSPNRYGKLQGPRRMLIQNGLATAVTFGFLLLAPHFPAWTFLSHERRLELSAAVSFLQTYPDVIYDIIEFALCSAISQVLLFATFKEFSSLLQMQVRVVRKTLSMLLSISWFSKTLTLRQCIGVTLVFGAISVEGLVQMKEEQKRKEKEL